MSVMTRSLLNERQCDNPDCTGCAERLYFSQYCHPKAGVEVMYAKGCGHLNLSCKKCGDLICVIAVGDGPGFVCESLQ
jgi:hypothetical protein